MPADVCRQSEVFTHTSVDVSDEETIASVPSTLKIEPSLKR